MWASHAIARCSSHDLSILLPHLLRSLRAQCIHLEPVLSLNTLLAGLWIVWRYGRQRTPQEPNKLDSKTCIDVVSEYTPINIAVRRENINIEDD